MQKKDRFSVTVDKGLMDEVRRIMGESGIKISTFVNMIFRSLVDAESLPMKNVYGNMAKSLLGDQEEDKPKKAKKKRR